MTPAPRTDQAGTGAESTSTVLEAKQAWRRTAVAIGAHLQACETCQPQPGGRAVRNACSEYGRVDAAERTAWLKYELAKTAARPPETAEAGNE